MKPKTTQMQMFTQGEDLPLFSDTTQAARAERFDPQAVGGTQTTMAACRFCLDTGTIRATKGDQKLSFCNCPVGIKAVEHHLKVTF